MTKKFLLDFEDGIAVVFFSLKGREYTMAFSNKWDLWAFLEAAPQAIEARVQSDTVRRAARDMAVQKNMPLHEAAQLLATMSPSEVTYLAKLGARNAPRPVEKFDITSLEF